MRQFDREDLTAEYNRGLAEGRAQGLKMAEDACLELERKRWELASRLGRATEVTPLDCMRAVRKLS